MDWIELIGGGVAIGLLVAAPIGPVALLCIRRTLSHGPLYGFLAGLSAALGDGIFAILAGFGVQWALDAIQGMGVALQLWGGVLWMSYGLCLLAQATPREMSRNPDGTSPRAATGSLSGALTATFTLTIANPATLIVLATSFAAFRVVVDFQSSALATWMLVLSVVTGSALWWLAITSVTGVLHRNLGEQAPRRINQASGILIVVSGAGLLGYAIWQRFLA